MDTRELGEALQLIMGERGWTQTQLGRELGVSQGWVSAVIRGKRDPAITRASDYLGRVGWEVVIRPKTEDSDPMKRREFMTAAASVMFVPSPTVGPYEDPVNVRELAQRVARARLEHGSGAIAPAAIRHVRRIESAVMSRDRKLQEAASHLATETVRTLNDSCHIEAGENVGRLALKLAKASGNPQAQLQAYDALATINLDHGGADRALMYAKHGVKLREVSDTQQAWMRLHMGLALAHVRGQENVARDEIETIRGLLQDTHGFSGPGMLSVEQYGQRSLTVADMMGTIALGLSDLGVYREAQAAFDECVSGIHSLPTLSAFFLSQQIKAALAASQESLAADRMLKLSRIAPLVNSPRVDSCIRDVLDQSAKSTAVPAIRNARDQLKTVRA